MFSINSAPTDIFKRDLISQLKYISDKFDLILDVKYIDNIRSLKSNKVSTLVTIYISNKDTELIGPKYSYNDALSIFNGIFDSLKNVKISNILLKYPDKIYGPILKST